MKIDKRTLDMMSALPDDSFWKMICAIGSASGFDLSQINVTEKELSNLRAAMSHLTDDDIGRALDIIASCKDSEK